MKQFRHGYERFHSLLGYFMPHFLRDIASPWHRSDTGVVRPISVDSEHRFANTSGCLITWNIVMAWKPTELEGQPNIFQNCHRFNGKRHRTFNSLLLFANKSMAFLIAKFSAWNTLHYVAKFVGFTYTKNITEDPSTCPTFHIKIVSIVMFLDVTVIYVCGCQVVRSPTLVIQLVLTSLIHLVWRKIEDCLKIWLHHCLNTESEAHLIAWFLYVKSYWT